MNNTQPQSGHLAFLDEIPTPGKDLHTWKVFLAKSLWLLWSLDAGDENPSQPAQQLANSLMNKLNPPAEVDDELTVMIVELGLVAAFIECDAQALGSTALAAANLAAELSEAGGDELATHCVTLYAKAFMKMKNEEWARPAARTLIVVELTSPEGVTSLEAERQVRGLSEPSQRVEALRDLMVEAKERVEDEDKDVIDAGLDALEVLSDELKPRTRWKIQAAAAGKPLYPTIEKRTYTLRHATEEIEVSVEFEVHGRDLIPITMATVFNVERDEIFVEGWLVLYSPTRGELEKVRTIWAVNFWAKEPTEQDALMGFLAKLSNEELEGVLFEVRWEPAQ